MSDRDKKIKDACREILDCAQDIALIARALRTLGLDKPNLTLTSSLGVIEASVEIIERENRGILSDRLEESKKLAGGILNALVEKSKQPPAPAACLHEKTRWGVSRFEPHMGASIEICETCGMSRSTWEQGASDWVMADLNDVLEKGSEVVAVPGHPTA